MTYKGHIKDGVVVLEGSVKLPEGAEVDVAISTPTATPTLFDRFADLVGSCSELPSDMAENHDHYLHGKDKKK